MKGWSQSETWARDGKNLRVEVKHWKGYSGTNKWNVYAYIFPGHPWFSIMDDSLKTYDQPFPFDFHGGITYRKEFRSKGGEIYCWQVGDDWMHYGDEYYEGVDKAEDAFGPFSEAEALYEALEEAMKGAEND